MSIKRTDISDDLMNGILEDAEFGTENGGLTVNLRGHYTVGEIISILEDLVYLDNKYQAIVKGINSTCEA